MRHRGAASSNPCKPAKRSCANRVEPSVFHYTPKHASWMNQIEIWFGILAKNVIRRGNFLSIDDLKRQILQFIDYFNATMARPFKWT